MHEKFTGLILSGLMLPLLAGAQTAPVPRDAPYPGTLQLAVDATDLDHRIFRVREHIPARAGALRLYYPQWLPGNHAPTGAIGALAGLTLHATRGGEPSQPLQWRRDATDMYAFHVDIPAGADGVDAEFQFLSPATTDQGRRVMTPDLLGVQWDQVLLYPAGYYAARIPVSAELTLPAGWSWASAARSGSQQEGNHVRFATMPLETLIDSPLFAGRNARRLVLDDNAASPVSLDVFADRPEQLLISDAQLAAHRNLVRETDALFGARHYAHYDFLLAVSDSFAGIGLEHHQSSENGVAGGYFTDWDNTGETRDLLAHEMTHSWNGKFRRPANLWTPNYNVPMQDSLLWVYEGQTEFWGDVLATRSGLWTPEFAREALAEFAADYQYLHAGRRWRSLADTTSQAIVDYHGSSPFQSWQRDTDYYTEGLLIWLDVDTLLRERSGEQRSLNDFARAFFGMRNGQTTPFTYTFDDVVKALNGLVPYDWRGFFATRIDGHGPDAPLDGLTRGGWKLVFNDTENSFGTSGNARRKHKDFGHSVGLAFADEGNEVVAVYWDTPAFQAGLVPGVKLIAVNGREFSTEKLRDAIKAATGNDTPIELLVKRDDTYQTVRLNYHGGLRYPHLQRVEGTPDRLGALYAPLRAQP